MTAKKIKVFLFAPETEVLKKLLAQHNNVRECKYITPHECVPYMRVRVRKYSNSVVGIAQQFAASAGPIVEYSLGVEHGDKLVGTIRIAEIDRYDEVVAVAQKFCKKVLQESHALRKTGQPEMFFTCRVSKIVAQKPGAHSWVEVFAVERHAVPCEYWKEAVTSLAQLIGGEAVFFNAEINEY